MNKTPIQELQEAIKIFAKYDDGQYPTNCSHDELFFNVNPEKVSEGDVIKLDELGFVVSEEYKGFISYKYGSC